MLSLVSASCRCLFAGDFVAHLEKLGLIYQKASAQGDCLFDSWRIVLDLQFDVRTSNQEVRNRVCEVRRMHSRACSDCLASVIC